MKNFHACRSHLYPSLLNEISNHLQLMRCQSFQRSTPRSNYAAPSISAWSCQQATKKALESVWKRKINQDYTCDFCVSGIRASSWFNNRLDLYRKPAQIINCDRQASVPDVHWLARACSLMKKPIAMLIFTARNRLYRKMHRWNIT